MMLCAEGTYQGRKDSESKDWDILACWILHASMAVNDSDWTRRATYHMLLLEEELIDAHIIPAEGG